MGASHAVSILMLVILNSVGRTLVSNARRWGSPICRTVVDGADLAKMVRMVQLARRQPGRVVVAVFVGCVSFGGDPHKALQGIAELGPRVAAHH